MFTFNPGQLSRLLESGLSVFNRLIGIRLGSLLALSAALLIASCGGGTTSVAPECVVFTDSFNNAVSCQEMANLAAYNGGGGGGGDGGDAGADGSAGDGAPIANTRLRFVDINNRTIETSTDANGYFRINLRGMKSPIVANVMRDNLAWRSMLVSEIVSAPANRKFYTINLTALTDKIASDVAVAAGRSGPAQLTPADVLKNLAAVPIAKEALNTQLKEKLLEAGLDPASFDALAQPFKTDLTGYDLVLEHVAVVQNPGGTTELLPLHSVGGSISGGGYRAGLVLKNGSDAISIGSIPSDGRIGFIRLWKSDSDAISIGSDSASSFTLPVQLLPGTRYEVQVATQPAAATCAVNNGSGVVDNANVTTVAVVCADTVYSLGGSIGGLGSSNSGLTLSLNNVQTLTVPANAVSFTFATGLPVGTAYHISIASQPVGATCSVAGGIGNMPAANLTSVVLTCSPVSARLGGSLSGLTANGLVLGAVGQTAEPAANAASFSFATPVAYGSAYSVTVLTQPTGLNCVVSNGSGSMGVSDINNVVVSCSVKAASLGGVVKNLTGTGLQLISNGQTATVTPLPGTPRPDVSFAFATPLAGGSSYNVTVKTQPAGQVCTIGNGSGTMSGVPVTSVMVTCNAIPLFTLGGTVSGNSDGLVLSAGADSKSFSGAPANFTFGTALAAGTSYNVTVQTQPAGQTCTVSNGSGIMPAANVSSVSVNCIGNPSTLGGTVSNLTGSGLVLTSSGQNVSVSPSASSATPRPDVSFTFATALAAGTTYNVTVQTQPSGQTCMVSNGSGVMATANISDVTVSCSNSVSTLGGTLSNLTGTGLVLTTGDGQTMGVAVNANSFTFPTPLTTGTSYSVTVQTQPSGQTCSVSNGSGIMPAANVTNVSVTCVMTPVPVDGVCGSANNVAVLTQPIANLCSAGSAGAVTGSGPWNWSCTGSNGGASASCAAPLAESLHFLGGSASGSNAGLVLSNNGQTVVVTTSPCGVLSPCGVIGFAFPTALATGTTYNVTVETQPSGQTCTVSNGRGVMPAANVTNVSVVCVNNGTPLPN